MSQRAGQKSSSFHEISRSASKSVREGGIEAASVQKVMAGAGLTVGAFYAHFKSKDELVQCGLDLAMKDVALLVEGAARGKTGAQALIAVAKKYLDSDHRDQPGVGCPLPASLGQGASKNTTTKQRKMLTSALETMADRLNQSSGESLAEEQIFGILAAIIGAQIAARATKGSDISDKILKFTSAFIESTLSGQNNGDDRP